MSLNWWKNKFSGWQPIHELFTKCWLPARELFSLHYEQLSLLLAAEHWNGEPVTKRWKIEGQTVILFLARLTKERASGRTLKLFFSMLWRERWMIVLARNFDRPRPAAPSGASNRPACGMSRVCIRLVSLNPYLCKARQVILGYIYEIAPTVFPVMLSIRKNCRKDKTSVHWSTGQETKRSPDSADELQFICASINCPLCMLF